jgi:hypothetical protein
MRVMHLLLLGSAMMAGTALAQNAGDASAEKTKPAAIHFDLAAPKPAESLPAAATLGELTYANEHQATAKPLPKAAPKPAAKAPPKPAPKPARKAVAAKPAKGPWMSEWRRAYIAKHGHQPPVPAPR